MLTPLIMRAVCSAVSMQLIMTRDTRIIKHVTRGKISSQNLGLIKYLLVDLKYTINKYKQKICVLQSTETEKTALKTCCLKMVSNIIHFSQSMKITNILK